MTIVYYLLWFLWFGNSEGIYWGQIVSAPKCLGPQLEDRWGLQLSEGIFTHTWMLWPVEVWLFSAGHTHIWPFHVTRASSPHGGRDSRTRTWTRWKLTWGSLHIPPQNPSTIFHWPRKILAEIQGQRTFNSHLGSQKCSQPCKKVKWDGMSIPMLGK